VARSFAEKRLKSAQTARKITVLYRFAMRGAGALKHRENQGFNAIFGSSGSVYRKAAGSVTRGVFDALRFASRLRWVNRGAAPERRMA